VDWCLAPLRHEKKTMTTKWEKRKFAEVFPCRLTFPGQGMKGTATWFSGVQIRRAVSSFSIGLVNVPDSPWRTKSPEFQWVLVTGADGGSQFASFAPVEWGVTIGSTAIRRAMGKRNGQSSGAKGPGKWRAARIRKANHLKLAELRD